MAQPGAMGFMLQCCPRKAGFAQLWQRELLFLRAFEFHGLGEVRAECRVTAREVLPALQGSGRPLAAPLLSLSQLLASSSLCLEQQVSIAFFFFFPPFFSFSAPTPQAVEGREGRRWGMSSGLSCSGSRSALAHAKNISEAPLG